MEKVQETPQVIAIRPDDVGNSLNKTGQGQGCSAHLVQAAPDKIRMPIRKPMQNFDLCIGFQG